MSNSNSQNNVVKFFRENETNGYLSNFFPINNRIIARLPNQLDSKGEPVLSTGFINIDGKEELEWYTSEHLFQALKFTGTNKNIDLVRQILNQPNTIRALEIGQSQLARSGWIEPSNYRLNAMKYAVRQKFSQNEELKSKLLATGNNTIIENTQSAGTKKFQNSFWGNGSDGNGANHLGEILMEVRAELKAEEENGGSVPNKPKTPTGAGGTNIDDNEEVKFLQHILYHCTELTENNLDQKYIDFPNKVVVLYKKNNFSGLEDYRIEMIKEILKKVEPKKVNELKKQILAELEKNNLISKTKEKELKKILEKEKENNKDKSPNLDGPVKDNNRPTTNENEDKSDESNKPVNNNNSDNNKNGNSPNQAPIINSPIDTKKITNSTTVAEAHQQAKIQIIKLFQKNGIKPGDLDKTLWKNYENWEKYLSTLTTCQEIAQFAEKLQKEIVNKKKINNNSQPTKSNWGRFYPWIIGGTLAIVIVFFLFLIKKRMKKKS